MEENKICIPISYSSSSIYIQLILQQEEGGMFHVADVLIINTIAIHSLMCSYKL